MKSIFLIAVFFAHFLLAIEPPGVLKGKDVVQNIWTAAYEAHYSNFRKALDKQRPLTTQDLLLNKLIESYFDYRCGALKSRDATLREIDDIIKTQYLDIRQIDYDTKKLHRSD